VSHGLLRFPFWHGSCERLCRDVGTYNLSLSCLPSIKKAADQAEEYYARIFWRSIRMARRVNLKSRQQHETRYELDGFLKAHDV
jgi:hypothetical protein